MNRRLRVLHVIQNLNYGGMERLFADIVLRLDPARFESHVLVLEYFGRFAQGLEGAATLHRAPPMSRWSMLWPRALAAQIQRIGPQVVHSHAGVWYKVAAAARLSRVPWVVHTEHGRQVPDPWLARCLGWLASRWTDRVVAVSDALRQHLAEQVVANPDRLVLIPNGVDTAVFRPQPASGRIAVELGFEPGSPVVGSIGRLEHIKGYDVLIEAFALLLQGWDQGPLPLLVVAGEGSERPRLETLVRRRGLGARVRLLGWRDDVHDLHAAFTLFAMGSRSEGTSVSLLEAMSAGLCPVVTAVGGNRAVLGPELAHRLVPGEDPVRLAEALRQALSDPQRLAADGQAARRRVEERFSLDAMVQAYEGVYLEGWARAGVAPNVPRTPIRR